MSSSSDRAPSRSSSSRLMAVNCFDTDAIRKTVSGLIGMSCSRFAIP